MNSTRQLYKGHIRVRFQVSNANRFGGKLGIIPDNFVENIKNKHECSGFIIQSINITLQDIELLITNNKEHLL